MGHLEIYVSNGVCKWDERLDNPSAVERRSESARDRLRRGLKLFHDERTGRLDCYFAASAGTEHQYIATFHASDDETLPDAALEAIDRAADRLGWVVRTGSETLYGLLQSANPVEPAVSCESVERLVESGETPVVLGTPDVASAVGVYRQIHESTVAVDSILVSRSGASSVMPAADVVLVPHEADQVGVQIRESAGMMKEHDKPGGKSVEEAEKAVYRFLAVGGTARRVKRECLADELAVHGIDVSVAAPSSRSPRDQLKDTVIRVRVALRRLTGRSLGVTLNSEERAALNDVVSTIVDIAEDPTIGNTVRVLSQDVLGPHGFEVDAINV